MKTESCVFLLLIITIVNSTKINRMSGQINDPAKFKYLDDCKKQEFRTDHVFCCEVIVNDTLSLLKTICVDLKKPNNLEPMKTISSYRNGLCRLDLQRRLFCKGSGNMDQAVGRWHLKNFIRVLNPPNKERTLEACDVGSNFSRCW